MTNTSKEIAYEIADEIGPDIAYVRFRGQTPEELYFTGIEIGVVVGTAILGSFCLGFIKGFSEGVGKEMGKQAAAQTISRLRGIIDKLLHANLVTIQVSSRLAKAEEID
jgi:hypothetical protein